MRDIVGFFCNDVAWMVDPLNKFPERHDKDIINNLGLIPQFISLNADDIIAHALKQYRYGGSPMTGGKVNGEGVHSYPGDPDLFPLAMCKAGDKLIFVYQSDIIAFVDVNTEEAVIYRFD